MTGAELDRLFADAGAVGWGYVPYNLLAQQMGAAACEKVHPLCPEPRSVLVAAFSYYVGVYPGNLSLYARGRDYHLVLTEKLTAICHTLSGYYPLYCFLPGADNSPLPEREAARLAGLGVVGRNGLVILPPYGSWIFLGTILTDLPLDLPTATPSKGCLNCGRCAAVCPGGALRGEQFDAERCLSHITQKKGTLSSEQTDALAVHPYAWGCDLCQTVCPYNAGVLETRLTAFREDLVHDLTASMVEGVTNREFRQQYGQRAFAWRGPAVIRRNLTLQSQGKEIQSSAEAEENE